MSDNLNHILSGFSGTVAIVGTSMGYAGPDGTAIGQDFRL